MGYLCGDCHQEHKVPKPEEDEQRKASTGNAGLSCVLALVRERQELVLQNDELGKQLSVQLGQIQALELKLEQVRGDFKELEADANAKEKESNRLVDELKNLIAEALPYMKARHEWKPTAPHLDMIQAMENALVLKRNHED